jgi:hydroxyquinol 1,2-dioxygenase
MPELACRQAQVSGPFADRHEGRDDARHQPVHDHRGGEGQRSRPKRAAASNSFLHGLIDHLHDYTRETNLTHDEWMRVLMFLYDCGKISTPERHEFILLSDVLGWSALVDMINTGRRDRGVEPRAVLSGRRARARRWAPICAGGATGVTVLVRGKVRDTLHNPLPGAIVDTWQADATGTYPIQEQARARTSMTCAASSTADAQGRYWYTTVLPKPYTVPYDGPVGELLRAGNRHAWRPAHLHYIVRAPAWRSITTEVFFENMEYIDNDAVFGVRRSLIAKIAR